MNSAEKTLTGTTTDAYVALTTNTAAVKRAVAAIKNTGAASMTIKVTSKHYSGGSIEFVEVDELELAAGAQLRYVETVLTSQLLVYVKSTGAGVPTTYVLEFIMGSL